LRQARWLNSGPAPKLGAVSYSVYLLHPIAINAAALYIVPQWGPLVAIGGTLGLAFAAYYLIEQPGIACGRRLARRWLADRANALAEPPHPALNVAE